MLSHRYYPDNDNAAQFTEDGTNRSGSWAWEAGDTCDYDMMAARKTPKK
jgi:hypothetical protein